MGPFMSRKLPLPLGARTRTHPSRLAGRGLGSRLGDKSSPALEGEHAGELESRVSAPCPGPASGAPLCSRCSRPAARSLGSVLPDVSASSGHFPRGPAQMEDLGSYTPILWITHQ